MKRKRKHIPIIELLASALAEKLPFDKREEYRAQKRSAREIVALFTADHIVLHAWDGADKWWNLDMQRRGPALKAKDATDTTRAAKAVRIDDKWSGFMRKVERGLKPKPQLRKPWGYHTRGRSK